jgi:hypothetical protein
MNDHAARPFRFLRGFCFFSCVLSIYFFPSFLFCKLHVTVTCTVSYERTHEHETVKLRIFPPSCSFVTLCPDRVLCLIRAAPPSLHRMNASHVKWLIMMTYIRLKEKRRRGHTKFKSHITYVPLCPSLITTVDRVMGGHQ